MVIKVQGSGERLLNESQPGYDRPATTTGISNFWFLINFWLGSYTGVWSNSLTLHLAAPWCAPELWIPQLTVWAVAVWEGERGGCISLKSELDLGSDGMMEPQAARGWDGTAFSERGGDGETRDRQTVRQSYLPQTLLGLSTKLWRYALPYKEASPELNVPENALF